MWNEWWDKLSSIDFWIQIMDTFKGFGPIAPIFMALLESLVPALPLVAIVAFNITTHGVIFGFLYSWIGSTLGSIVVFCFFRYVIKRYFGYWIAKQKTLYKALNWVANRNVQVLFLISLMPFTPSSFINIAFALSDFNAKSFIITISVAKLFMIGALAFFGNSVIMAFENPWYILLAICTLLAMYLVSRYINKKHDLPK